MVWIFKNTIIWYINFNIVNKKRISKENFSLHRKKIGICFRSSIFSGYYATHVTFVLPVRMVVRSQRGLITFKQSYTTGLKQALF